MRITKISILFCLFNLASSAYANPSIMGTAISEWANPSYIDAINSIRVSPKGYVSSMPGIKIIDVQVQVLYPINVSLNSNGVPDFATHDDNAAFENSFEKITFFLNTTRNRYPNADFSKEFIEPNKPHKTLLWGYTISLGKVCELVVTFEYSPGVENTFPYRKTSLGGPLEDFVTFENMYAFKQKVKKAGSSVLVDLNI